MVELTMHLAVLKERFSASGSGSQRGEVTAAICQLRFSLPAAWTNEPWQNSEHPSGRFGVDGLL